MGSTSIYDEYTEGLLETLENLNLYFPSHYSDTIYEMIHNMGSSTESMMTIEEWKLLREAYGKK